MIGTVTEQRYRHAVGYVIGGLIAGASGALTLSVGSPSALAQGLLPATGYDVHVGDLRSQFSQAFKDNQTVAGTHGWTISPAIDLSEAYDTGVYRRNGSFTTDLITRITPSISAVGDGTRLSGNFYYAPTFNIYASNTKFSGIDHNLNATATFIAIQDLLFLDLRGYAGVQSLRGGLPTNGTAAVSQGDRQQTASVTIKPYLRHSFDGMGTLNIGYSFERTVVDRGKTSVPLASFAPGALNGNLTTHQENASFTTGENFGRIQNTLSAVAIQYQGVGLYAGAHRETLNDQLTYAISRVVAVNVSGGYQNIHYGSSSPYNSKGPIWGVGTTLTPNQDTSIALNYGRLDGGTSFTLDASLAPTARTRAYVRYSEGLETGFEAIQRALAASTVGVGGVSIDPVTGAPILVANNFFGSQSALFRTRRASLTAVWQLTLDTLTTTIEYTNRMPALGTPSALAPAYEGVYGSVAWSHVVTDALTANTFLQYGTRAATKSGVQATLSTNISVNYAINPTLNTYAQYTHQMTSGPTFGQPPTRDIAVIGVRKGF